MVHLEIHRAHRIGWLRAAVLGANDGIVSTASLVIGVAASSAERGDVLIAGVAGLVAGAMSMAAGEYVSVSSQSDTEAADIARETRELAEQPEHELEELTQMFIERGLQRALAHEVAVALTAHDALAAHAREELGISELTTARPVQAALTSAASFALGAACPLVSAAFGTGRTQITIVGVTTLVLLATLGALGAHTGGASPQRGAARVMFWGALAMIVTATIGALVGAVI
jgi:VIT1/CCC1 family predicted Fe2+/Mn2+ transporter